MPDTISLSLLIPVFNESQRIPKKLDKVLHFMKQHPEICELIIVDDGSTDTTYRYIQNQADKNPMITLVHYDKNKGKGHAVRQGFAQAKGDLVLFMDADLSTPLSEIKTLTLLAHKTDIVIGSRCKGKEVIYHDEHKRRLLLSRVGAYIRKQFFLEDIEDTQCGFKLFNKKARTMILAKSTIDGYAFDMEFLVIAQKNNLTIKEVGVSWHHAGGGHLHNPFRLLRACISVFLSMTHIYIKSRRGLYTARIL